MADYDAVGLVVILMWIIPYFMLILYTTKDKLGFTSLLIFGLITWVTLLYFYLKLEGVLL